MPVTSIGRWSSKRGHPVAGDEEDPASYCRGRRSSPSLATSITGRRRCWTGLSVSTWPPTRKGGITQHIRAYRVMKDGRPRLRRYAGPRSVHRNARPRRQRDRHRRAGGGGRRRRHATDGRGHQPRPGRQSAHRRGAEQDRPARRQPEEVYGQLAGNELLPSEWGGETEVVKTSATTGEGIDKLLETLLTVAELHEYKANPDGPGRGTCLESEMHEDRGVIVKLLVQTGTLRLGDIVVCGAPTGASRRCTTR